MKCVHLPCKLQGDENVGPVVRQKDRLTEGGSGYRRKRTDQWGRPRFRSQLTQTEAGGLGHIPGPSTGKVAPRDLRDGIPHLSSLICWYHPTSLLAPLVVLEYNKSSPTAGLHLDIHSVTRHSFLDTSCSPSEFQVRCQIKLGGSTDI